MRAFAYASAADLEEAITAASDAETAFLAGGTELVNWMRLGIAAPARVLDIGRLGGLDRIEARPGGGVRIGALARLNDVAEHDRIARDYPVLSQAILSAASPQIRNIATIGGNPLQKTRCPYFRAEEELPCNKRVPGSGCSALHGINDRHAIFGWIEDCVAVQPSDPAVALAALDAMLVTEHRDGPRRIPLTELYVLRADRIQEDTVLRAGELVTGIELAAPARRSAYLKARERTSYEYAIVSAAVALDLDGEIIRQAQIALGSVAYKPWRLEAAEELLIGSSPADHDAVRAAVEADFADARPLSHNGHKVPLAINLTCRAIRAAARVPS